MTKEIGYYSLIQFCPDPEVAEAVNIGLLAFCPKTGFLDVHISSDNKRVHRVFGTKICNSPALQKHKDGLREWIMDEKEKFESLENAQKFIASQVNQIIFTNPRPTIWREGAKNGCLNLFTQLVQEVKETHSKRVSLPKRRILKSIKSRLKGEFTRKIITDFPNVEIVDSYHTVEPLFGFRNGHFNAVFGDVYTGNNYANLIMRSTFITEGLRQSSDERLHTAKPIFLCRITESAKSRTPVIKRQIENHGALYYDDESELVDVVEMEAKVVRQRLSFQEEKEETIQRLEISRIDDD